jgi:hypothetical protein
MNRKMVNREMMERLKWVCYNGEKEKLNGNLFNELNPWNRRRVS